MANNRGSGVLETSLVGSTSTTGYDGAVFFNGDPKSGMVPTGPQVMGLFPSSYFCEVVSFHQKYRVFILMQVAPPIICQVFCCISMLSIVSDMVY